MFTNLSMPFKHHITTVIVLINTSGNNKIIYLCTLLFGEPLAFIIAMLATSTPTKVIYIYIQHADTTINIFIINNKKRINKKPYMFLLCMYKMKPT
eukprot:UN02306